MSEGSTMLVKKSTLHLALFMTLGVLLGCVPLFVMANEISADEWQKLGAGIGMVTAAGVVWIIKAFVSHYLGTQGSQRVQKLSEERPTRKTMLGIDIVDDIVK
jgi:hypothetical protein